ncbi:uncharacterized protein J7T54_007754 [Emericellopsis cladophorae]|uniref:Uncharacterized protein n=1 Tax=Emericellopsis cladophorae TaxID=2686198 RepID=A0A9Q0BBE4_9HYPO|nr:uncharacterized protein J7T54_007754 [Emericellopsis cladophorae]KAI6779227.1 hypothetical protein J7T54_007754 [Emericellopsis cladophorae]
MEHSSSRAQHASEPSLFIISSDTGKPDAQTRRLIRRHVMRGKNRRKQYENKCPGQLGSSSDYWTLTSPRKITSELSLLTGVPHMQHLIYRAFTIVKPSTYKIEVIVADDPRNNMLCFPALASNPALLHSVCFFAQAFHDTSKKSSLSPLAQTHLTMALVYLQKSLVDSVAATSEATMSTVVSLATAAAILGDLDSLQKHVDGLSRMIELRGGLDTLEPGNFIVLKATRLDFGLAMATGAHLRFTPKNLSWDPVIAQGVHADQLTELAMLRPELDTRLLNIWADLRVFARAANDATSSGVKMPHDLFHRLSSAIPARLIALKDACRSSPVSELLRLAMIAFMKTILVQIEGLGPRLTALAADLKEIFLAKPSCPSDLLLWVLFTSTISIFENLGDHEWLVSALGKTLSELGLRTWPSTRNALKHFLWIDFLHNRPGQDVFSRFISHPTEETA